MNDNVNSAKDIVVVEREEKSVRSFRIKINFILKNRSHFLQGFLYELVPKFLRTQTKFMPILNNKKVIVLSVKIGAALRLFLQIIRSLEI